MSASSVAERLESPLVWVIAAVFTLASVSALIVDPVGPAIDATRAGTAAEGPLPTDPALHGVEVIETFPSAGEPDPSGGPSSDPAGAGEAGPIGISAVPAAGVYRYQVQTTDAAGESTVQEELREINVLSGDRSAGTVEVSARLAGESQVSVIDWSPSGALVRSTRIESSASVGQDCTWDPPFPELGALADGASWDLESTCRVPVGGVPTTFTITGQGSVEGQATVTFGGEELRVWQIRRDRTTTIAADLGAGPQQQSAHEEGTLLFDPVRGVVIRSDVTVTLDGPRSGVTRRISVLQAS